MSEVKVYSTRESNHVDMQIMKKFLMLYDRVVRIV